MAWAKLVDGIYYGIYRDADGKERSAGSGGKGRQGEKKALELAFAAEKEVQEGRGIDPASRNLTFRRYVEDMYLPNLAREINTVRGYDQRIKAYMMPVFGNKQMRRITHSMVAGWLEDMPQPRGKALSANTRKTILATFRTIMRTAIKDHVIAADPTAAIETPKFAKRKHAIIDADYDKFLEGLAEIKNERDRLFIELSLALMTRVSETRALRPRHLNPLLSRVTVCDTVSSARKDYVDRKFPVGKEPQEGWERISDHWYKKPYAKNGEPVGVDVEIPRALMRRVEAYIAEKNIGRDDLIFTSSSGLPLDVDNLREDVWKPMLGKHGVNPRVRFHDLRHTGASLAIDEGVPIPAVQVILRHSSPRTTEEMYVHPTSTAASDVASGLERALAKRRRTS